MFLSSMAWMFLNTFKLYVPESLLMQIVVNRLNNIIIIIIINNFTCFRKKISKHGQQRNKQGSDKRKVHEELRM